jgi:hypothetical protein
LHRLAFAPSAENLSCGKVSSNVPTGMSGIILNVLLVMPAGPMNVFACNPLLEQLKRRKHPSLHDACQIPESSIAAPSRPGKTKIGYLN